MHFKKENIKPLLKLSLVIVSVCLFFGITTGFRSDLGMVTALLSDSSGISYSEVQLAFTFNTYICALAAPFLAALTIKKSSRFVLILGVILTVAGLLLMVASTSFITLFIGVSILFAIGSSALSFGIIFGAVVPFLKENVAIVISTVFTITGTFFGVLFQPVIQNLTDTIGFTGTIIVFCLLFIIIIPLIFLFSKGGKDKEVQEIKKKIKFKDVSKDLLRNKITIIMMILMFVMGMMQGLSNHYYTAIIDFNLPEASYSIMKIVSLAGSLLFTFIVIKMRKRLSFTVFVILFYAAMEISILINPQGSLAYLIFIYLGTFVLGLVYPLSNAIIRREYAPYIIGTVICFVGVFNTIARGINGSLGGFIYDITGNFNLLIIIEAIIGIAGGIAIFILARMVKKDEKKKLQNSENEK